MNLKNKRPEILGVKRMNERNVRKQILSVPDSSGELICFSGAREILNLIFPALTFWYFWVKPKVQASNICFFKKRRITFS